KSKVGKSEVASRKSQVASLSEVPDSDFRLQTSNFKLQTSLAAFGFHERREHAILIVRRTNAFGSRHERLARAGIDGAGIQERQQDFGPIVVGRHRGDEIER